MRLNSLVYKLCDEIITNEKKLTGTQLFLLRVTLNNSYNPPFALLTELIFIWMFIWMFIK